MREMNTENLILKQERKLDPETRKENLILKREKKSLMTRETRLHHSAKGTWTAPEGISAQFPVPRHHLKRSQNKTSKTIHTKMMPRS